MLTGIEGLQPEGRDHKVRTVIGQIARQNIVFDEPDMMRAVPVQSLDRAGMHAGGNVDSCDRADFRETLEEMRPNLARPSHQIVAARARRLRQRGDALPPPSLGEAH